MRISDWSSDVCSSDLVAAVMLGLDQPCLGGAVRRRAAVDRLGIADREFGADFGFDRRAIARIDAALVGLGVAILVMDEGRADAQFLVIGLIADAAAGVEQDRKSTRLNSSH